MFYKFFLVYFVFNLTSQSITRAETKISQTSEAAENAKTNCKQTEFKCENRRCIPLTALCDSANDCGDNSDENGDSCKIVSTVSCPVENQEIKCGVQGSDPGNSTSSDQKSHAFLCQWQRIPKNESDDILQCKNGVWTPKVTHCVRLCQNVTVLAESVECHWNGKRQNCTAPLLTGTQIQAKCPSDHKATFEKIACDDHGVWDHDRVECIPTCGRLTKHKLNYIQNVRPAEKREFPWNVGLYGKDKSVPLCPATIVSPSLVLTTATCVQELQNRSHLISRENIEVIVSKIRREASKKDDDLQKSYQVRNIFLLEDGARNVTNNLALLELHEKVNSSAAVYPVCVNWNRNEKWTPSDNYEGQITTWRIRYENGTSGRTSTLAKIAASYSTNASCLKTSTRKDDILTQDQFCVNIGKFSPHPYQTGSAWTYVEKSTNFHFLGGLLNNDYRREGKNAGHSNVSFVDLNYPPYVDWMNKIRKQVEPISSEISFSHDREDIDCRPGSRTASPETRMANLDSTIVISSEDSTSEKTDNCTLPDVASLNASNYVLDCRSIEEKCRNIGEDTIVSLANKLSLTCKPGYVLKSNETAACVNNQWKTFPRCVRTR